VTDSPDDLRGDVAYLDVDDALEVFGASIGGTATQAADQLRDRAALAGALARPINYAQYEGADLALQAAMVAHGIAETQPFIDGNKRAALVVMLVFLELNGARVEATDRERAD
jgi:death-on-curing family protein